MAVSFFNSNPLTAQQNTTGSVSIAYPAETGVNDLALVFIVNKLGAVYPSETQTGWQFLGRYFGGLTSNPEAENTGDGNVSVFYRQLLGNEAGTNATFVSHNATAYNVSLTKMYVFSNQYSVINSTAGAAVWDIQVQGGNDQTAGTAWSITTPSTWNVAAGDLMVVGSFVNTTATGASAQSMTMTGITFGTASQHDTSSTSTGWNIRNYVSSFPVTAGNSTGTTTHNMTFGSATTWGPTGSTAFVRLREVAPATRRIFHI
jgi:hypothetical protein